MLSIVTSNNNGGQQQRAMSNPTPGSNVESSASSKIDKILAKIDKNRSDSMKNQMGIIFKKTANINSS